MGGTLSASAVQQFTANVALGGSGALSATAAPLTSFPVAAALSGTGVLAAEAYIKFQPFNETNTARTNQPVPAGTGGCWVTLIGGGGGGAGGGNNYFGGGGGGGAAISRVFIPAASLGSTYSVAVGTGGTAGAASGNGGSGVASSFSSGGITLTAGGGGYGYNQLSGSSGAPGNATASGITATTCPGGQGDFGYSSSGGSSTGGSPGTAPAAAGGGAGTYPTTGRPGGSSATVTGGAAGSGSAVGGSPAAAGAGDGGAGGGGGGGGGGTGGAYGGGGGGGGNGKPGAAGGAGYTLIEWVGPVAYTVYIPFRNGICSTLGCYANGTPSSAWGGTPTTLVSGGNSNGPYGAVDGNGNVYTTNGGFSTGKIVQTSQSGTNTNMTPSGIGATVKGLDVSADNTTLYVVDQTNAQVQKITISTLAMASFGFTGLSLPVDVTVDSAGSCYVVSASAITKRTSGGAQSTITPPSGTMVGIYADRSDTLWVATTAAVYQQSGTQGSGTWTQILTTTAAFQGSPAVDPDGVCYILDSAYKLWAYSPNGVINSMVIPAGGGNNSRIAGICAGVPNGT